MYRLASMIARTTCPGSCPPPVGGARGLPGQTARVVTAHQDVLVTGSAGGVTPRSTVRTHLSHVYAKLGVSDRTELATLAGEAGRGQFF